MKKILLSLLTIALIGGGAVGATRAYFTSTISADNNTFSMGTVTLNNAWTTHLPLNLTNLTPGAEKISDVVGVGYGGTIDADLYVGMKWTSGDDLKDILDYYIEEVTSAGDHLANKTGWAGISNIFGSWNKIADNMTNGQWKYYKIHIRVHSDAANTYQGDTTTDQLFIHAVQHGFAAPATAPWLYTP